LADVTITARRTVRLLPAASTMMCARMCRWST